MSYINIRDIIDNKKNEPEEYKKWKDAIEDQTNYDFEELAENESIMIPDDDFENYAQELAEDIGVISKDYEWPLYSIDWERAAEELKIDYSSVEVDEIAYWFRAY